MAVVTPVRAKHHQYPLVLLHRQLPRVSEFGVGIESRNVNVFCWSSGAAVCWGHCVAGYDAPLPPAPELSVDDPYRLRFARRARHDSASNLT